MKAILLVRVSTTVQELKEQEREVYELAVKDGYEDKDIIPICEKESAIKLKEEERLGLNRLKEVVEKEDVKDVYIWEVSSYAREFAQKHNLKLIEFLPEYDKYGRTAPLVRNKLIVDECDCVLAFWDGTSRGTKFTLDYVKEKGKPVQIVNYITNEITRIK